MFESSRAKRLGAVANAAFSLPTVGVLSIFLSSVLSVNAVQAKTTEVIDIPSITAERVTRSTRSGDELSRDWIQLSPNGLRARQSGANNKFEYLQNNVLEKLWMMDWNRKLLIEIESGFDEESEENASDDDFAPFVARVGDKPQSSILMTEPCLDLVGTEIGEAKWREQAVTVWECGFAGGEQFSKVFFSHSWGIVVREERIDQTTIELNNIKRATFSVDHFTPPTFFRKTDFRELMIGSPEIGSYSE